MSLANLLRWLPGPIPACAPRSVEPPRPWPRNEVECRTRGPQRPAQFNVGLDIVDGYQVIRPERRR